VPILQTRVNYILPLALLADSSAKGRRQNFDRFIAGQRAIEFVFGLEILKALDWSNNFLSRRLVAVKIPGRGVRTRGRAASQAVEATGFQQFPRDLPDSFQGPPIAGRCVETSLLCRFQSFLAVSERLVIIERSQILGYLASLFANE
jgi:hypothetical protein